MIGLKISGWLQDRIYSSKSTTSKWEKYLLSKVQYDQVKFVLHLVVVIITQSYISREKVEKDKEFEGNNRIKIIFIL